MKQNLSDRRPRILVAVDFSMCMEALDCLREVGEVEYVASIEQERLLERIGGFDAYYAWTENKVDLAFLERAERLEVVCTASTGTDHIDVAELKRRGIHLIAITHEYELLDRFTSTAELTWGLLLACRRRIPWQFERAKGGEVGPDGFLPPQLSGKTLGIIGYGRLGKMVAEYGKAFRMRVLACDIKPITAPGIEQVDFDTLISTSDIISLHVHLSDATRWMINRDVIARMKPGVVIVNTSRGDLIREDDLIEALESGHVAAAGLDVFHDEWDPNLRDHTLHQYARTHDNLILTPHVGGCSLESVSEARTFVARKLAKYLTGRKED